MEMWWAPVQPQVTERKADKGSAGAGSVLLVQYVQVKQRI